MKLTEKGTIAFTAALEHYSNEPFTAASLSAKSGISISAATLNGIANQGLMTRLGGSPVKFKLVPNAKDLYNKTCESRPANENLRKAQTAKNDEFYTQYQDIEKEILQYDLRGKKVLCNCNDGLTSEFLNYFVNNFDCLELDELVCLTYNKDGKAYKYTKRPKVDLMVEQLIGSGAFDSQEGRDALAACDIVITNPPFSQFRDFVNLILSYKKDFLIIGSKNAITYKEFFPLLMSGKVHIGNFNVSTFKQPDGTDKKFGNIGWFTTLSVAKAAQPIPLTATYDPQNYPTYDNFRAIEVSRTANIPKDYDGVMGVPISFLDKFCPTQFKIVGWSRHNDEGMDGGYWTGGCSDATINGKQVYRRILIQKI